MCYSFSVTHAYFKIDTQCTDGCGKVLMRYLQLKLTLNHGEKWYMVCSPIARHLTHTACLNCWERSTASFDLWGKYTSFLSSCTNWVDLAHAAQSVSTIRTFWAVSTLLAARHFLCAEVASADDRHAKRRKRLNLHWRYLLLTYLVSIPVWLSWNLRSGFDANPLNRVDQGHSWNVHGHNNNPSHTHSHTHMQTHTCTHTPIRQT